MRARVLDGRLESVRRLAEQRQNLLDEVERAATAERERLVAELAGRPEEHDDDTWPQEESRLTGELESAESEHAGVSAAAGGRQGSADGAPGRARPARRRARDRAGDGGPSRAPPRGARPASRSASGRSTRRSPPRWAVKADEEREAVAAEAASRDALRAAESTAAAAAAAAVEASRQAREADDAHRATLLERRALEAEADHLRAALRDIEDVGGEVLEVAGEFPGTVSLAGSVTCEPGYERALAAALAQLSGALAVPEVVDHWSLLDALKRAGIGLVRLVVPARRRPSVGFPGAAPLADKVSFGEHEGLEGALADVVIVDDLRAVPAEFTGLAVTREGEFYRPADGQIGPGRRGARGPAARAPRVARAAGGEARRRLGP